ncbi:MAG: S41 family peptidase, partial [Chloroflexota bacterium]
METFQKTFLNSVLVLLGLILAFLLGYLTRAYLYGADFQVLEEAYVLLDTHGFNDLPESPAMEYGMIRGMVQAYGDPYTSFLEPVQRELESDVLEGKFGGIGVTLEKDAQDYWSLFPFPESPAARAGVQEGDRLVKVEDLDISPETPVETIQAEVRGKVGTQVNITIARAPDFAPSEISIKREEIALPSVLGRIEPSESRLGIVQVNIIAASTPDEIQKTIEDLQKRGATHFALDLRNNGGGLLNSGVDIARLFLEDGDVIQQQYRGKEVETFEVEKPGALVDIPLVVLVNEYTASASEIIAGALQAHHRALLIGATTYGKDTLQLVFTLHDGSSLHVTAAHWWIPGIEFPKDGHGLVPDIAVASDTNDPQAITQA